MMTRSIPEGLTCPMELVKSIKGPSPHVKSNEVSPLMNNTRCQHQYFIPKLIQICEPATWGTTFTLMSTPAYLRSETDYVKSIASRITATTTATS